MIYQTEDLLNDIKELIAKSDALKKSIILVGKIPHEELVDWFSASDFYISASYKEGSGYALAEAMACGCIPVVTNIPSFNKMTLNGKYGYLYTAGNDEDLLNKLIQLKTISKQEWSTEIIEYAKKEFSFKAIADQIFDVSLSLVK